MPTASLLRSLPPPDLMKRRLRTFAMLDAVVAPGFRGFEFHPGWARGEQMGAFKDGSGNFFFAWFSRKGAVIRGFQHESRMSPFQHTPPRLWPGLLEGFPKSLASANTEPAFAQDELTFCLWNTGDSWKCGPVKPPKGPDADGAEELLACFRSKFREWAEGYYGQKLDGPALELLWWQRKPIDEAAVAALNPEFDGKEVKAEAKLLGWPLTLRGGGKVKKENEVALTETKPRAPSFGQAEFTVRCEPTYVALVVHGKEVKRLKADVYEELFDLVQARLSARK